MSDEIDIVICSGYSPGARVLRAAVREVSKQERVRMVTVAPALAGLPKAIEEMNSLKEGCVVVVDGCEGFCALQTLNQFGIRPNGSLMLNKHVQVTKQAVDMEAGRILKLVQEVRGRCAKG
jgi:uncharacterized metal-binding protein